MMARTLVDRFQVSTTIFYSSDYAKHSLYIRIRAEAE